MFKYMKSDLVSVLENCMVRYTQLGEFNDPFEGQPCIDALYSPDHESEFRESSLGKVLEHHHSKIREEHGTILNALYAGVPILSPELALSALPFALKGFPQIAANELRRLSDREVGAFCLSEVPDSLLMWAHYAENHAGFVLEFDTHHQHFDNNDNDIGLIDRLSRVLYREARPKIYLMDLTAETFTVKSAHWAYEREWRIFRRLSERDDVKIVNGIDCCLFEFPPSALLSVTLGARSTAKTREAVKSMLSKKSNLAHVEIRYAVPDDSHFLLRIVDESP